MRTMPAVVAAIAAMFALSTGALALPDPDHAAHHPASAASAPKAARPMAPKARAAASAPMSSRVDAQMRAMRDMHQKMMAAGTPGERQALMAEHMKTMQEGMAMMDQMHSGSDGAMHMDHDMMGKRMDMMQMMMEMMMDRDANAASEAR